LWLNDSMTTRVYGVPPTGELPDNVRSSCHARIPAWSNRWDVETFDPLLAQKNQWVKSHYNIYICNIYMAYKKSQEITLLWPWWPPKTPYRHPHQLSPQGPRPSSRAFSAWDVPGDADRGCFLCFFFCIIRTQKNIWTYVYVYMYIYMYVYIYTLYMVDCGC
jgi:hypothetical protein